MRRLGHLNHWTEDHSLLDEASTSIRELDSFQKVLSSYLTSVQETVDALRGAIRPFSFAKGIDTLPDEILSIIYESFENYDYQAVTRDCSLVSRRFRRVVLNTPRFWSNVSTGMKRMECVSRHLERSKSIGLNVEIVPKPWTSPKIVCYLNQLEVFDAALSYTDRWESFTLGVASSMPPDISERLNKLTHLLRLKVFRFECNDNMEEFEDPIFLKSSCAPQLHRLHTINYLPGLSALPSTLSSLEFVTTDIEFGPQLCHRLCTLLVSVPNLTELSLTLECIRTPFTSDDKIPPCILRNLNVLKFTIESVICDELLSFREALITPAIVECIFSVENAKVGCCSGYKGLLSANYLEVMLCHDVYPTLESLTVRFDSVDMDDDIAHFIIPFQKVPNLCELTVDTRGFSPVIHSRKIPALRSLTVRKVGTGAWVWVKGLWEKLRQQGDLPGLQKVVIGKRTVGHEWVENRFEDVVF